MELLPGRYWLVWEADGQRFRDRCVVKEIGGNGRLYYREVSANWNAHADTTWKCVETALDKGDRFEPYDESSDDDLPAVKPEPVPVPVPTAKPAHKPRGAKPKGRSASGVITVRVDPILQEQIGVTARDLCGVSVNQWCAERLAAAVQAEWALAFPEEA